MNERIYMAMRLLGMEVEETNDVAELREMGQQVIDYAIERYEDEKRSSGYSNDLMTKRCRLIAVFAREWLSLYSIANDVEWKHGPLPQEKLEPGMLLRVRRGPDYNPEISVVVTMRDYGHSGMLCCELVPLYDPERGSAVCSSGSIPSNYDYWEGIAPLLKVGKYPALWQGEQTTPEPEKVSCTRANCEGTLSTYDPEGAAPGTYPGLLGCSNCDGIFRIRGQVTKNGN